MSDQTCNFEIKILILWENESWIAQGMNFDITGHGKTLNEVFDNFERTFVGQILLDIHHGQRPLANIKEAPPFYWKKFEEAKRLTDKVRFSLPQQERQPNFMVSAGAADVRIYA